MQGILDKVETRQWVVIENQGQQIFGILHRPTNSENPPLVVALHGFASSKHGSNRCYVTLAEELAKEGIATLRFDFRGSGDSEGALSDITFEDLISDAIAIFNYDHFEGIDSSRMGVFGASLGGAIAVYASQMTSKVKAMALWSPVASGELWYRDFLTQYPEHINADPSQVLSSYRGVKLHPQFREQFGQMAAYKVIQELQDLPILHMHGEKDDTVSVLHQKAYRGTCEGMNCRFITYADSQHSLGYSVNFPEVIKETKSWFQEHL